MRVLIILFVVACLLVVPVIGFGDPGSGDQGGFDVLEKGVKGASGSIITMVASVIMAAGMVLLPLGLFNVFSTKGRNDPDIKGKGIKQVVIGAIFVAGAGVTIANMFTSQILNETTETAKEKWEESWNDQ